MRPSLLFLFALCLSLHGYAQKRQPPLKPPVPVTNVPDNGLAGTKWRMTVDTNGQRTLLKFYRVKDNAPVPYLVQFTAHNTFLLTVLTTQCSFKARGTCDVGFPSSTPREGEIELTSPGGFRFSRYNNQSPCAEKLKKKIGNNYILIHHEEDSFSLQEEVVESPIAVPVGQ